MYQISVIQKTGLVTVSKGDKIVKHVTYILWKRSFSVSLSEPLLHCPHPQTEKQ